MNWLNEPTKIPSQAAISSALSNATWLGEVNLSDKNLFLASTQVSVQKMPVEENYNEQESRYATI